MSKWIFPTDKLENWICFQNWRQHPTKENEQQKICPKKIAAQSQTANTYTKNLYRLYVRSRARETKETQEKRKTRKGYRLRLLWFFIVCCWTRDCTPSATSTHSTQSALCTVLTTTQKTHNFRFRSVSFILIVSSFRSVG